jgi:hypothetical protein
VLGLLDCLELGDNNTGARIKGKTDGRVVVAGDSAGRCQLRGCERRKVGSVVNLPDEWNCAALAHEHCFMDHLQ